MRSFYKTAILCCLVQRSIAQFGLTSCKQNVWALTFDDGPSAATPNLLATLREYNIKATFFVVGQYVKEWSSTVLDTYQDGHEIGIHTWNHPKLTDLSDSEIRDQLESTRDIIETTIGEKALFMRPPYGEIDQRVFDIAKDMGFEVILWDRDTFDATNGPNGVGAQVDVWIKANYQNGIVLQHDLFQSAVDQVPQLIEKLRNHGANFVTISECLEIDAYEFKQSTVIETTTTIPPEVTPVLNSTSLQKSENQSEGTSHAVQLFLRELFILQISLVFLLVFYE